MRFSASGTAAVCVGPVRFAGPEVAAFFSRQLFSARGRLFASTAVAGGDMLLYRLFSVCKLLIVDQRLAMPLPISVFKLPAILDSTDNRPAF